MPGPADFGSLTLPAVLSSSLSLPFGLWDPFFAGADFGPLTLSLVLSSSLSLPFGLWDLFFPGPGRF